MNKEDILDIPASLKELREDVTRYIALCNSIQEENRYLKDQLAKFRNARDIKEE